MAATEEDHRSAHASEHARLSRQVHRALRRPRVQVRVRAPTCRERVGRVAKLFIDAGFGFIRGHSGKMAYFDAADVIGDLASLRVGHSVRFQLDTAGYPRAIRIEPA